MRSVEQFPSRGFLGLLVVLGCAWRLVINALTVAPREDGANYLWMAERFAEGEPCAALSEVFSPLLPLIIAVPVALGMEPFFAGQLALAFVGALVVVPVVHLSEALFVGTGRCAGCLAVFAARPSLLGAEVYTEPLFILVGCVAFLLGVKKKYWSCGALAGLAFWIRPEAALIPMVFLLGDRRSWRSIPVLLAAIGLLALWRGSCGHGYDPMPKLAFIAAHNVAEDTDAVGFVLRVLQNLPRALWLLVEAFNALAILAVIGLWRRRPAPVLWLLALGLLVVCAYVPRRRFLVNWMFCVAPLAAAGLVHLPRRRLWLAGVILLNLVLALTGGVEFNRLAERRVAEHLREMLRPGEVIAGDMTRVLYFAGQRPLEPRHYSAEELSQSGRGARFVVLRAGRETTPAVRRELVSHAPLELTGELGDLARQRGILVLELNRRP